MFNLKRYNILKMLLENMGKEVSGETMSRTMAVSRAAIAKHIKKLRTMGFDIQARQGGGYTITEIPDIINEELVNYFGKNDGLPVLVKEVVTSTNIVAKEWAEKGASSGAVIAAKEQTLGRGRRQRQWQSIDGGIWCSMILKLSISPGRIQPATLAAAMAVSKAIKQNCEFAEPKIKWPNDILINDKKVCGILTEFIGDIDELRYLIVGIGINNSFDADLFEGELLYKASTLKSENIIINSSKLIADVRDNLLDITKNWCETHSPKHIIDFYRENMAYKDQQVTISGIGENTVGVLKDIDTDGALILKTDEGEKKIISGEISVRKA